MNTLNIKTLKRPLNSRTFRVSKTPHMLAEIYTATCCVSTVAGSCVHVYSNVTRYNINPYCGKFEFILFDVIGGSMFGAVAGLLFGITLPITMPIMLIAAAFDKK